MGKSMKIIHKWCIFIPFPARHVNTTLALARARQAATEGLSTEIFVGPINQTPGGREVFYRPSDSQNDPERSKKYMVILVYDTIYGMYIHL